MGKIIPVVLAAAGGMIAGVLLAPKSGKETRQDLLNKSDEYKDKAHESMKVIKKGASSIKDELKAGGNAVREIAEDVTNEVKNGANRASAEVNRRATTIQDEAKDTAESAKRSAR